MNVVLFHEFGTPKMKGEAVPEPSTILGISGLPLGLTYPFRPTYPPAFMPKRRIGVVVRAIA